MRILRGQRGYTTMELLMASTIFIAVLTVTLGPMESLFRTSRVNEQQNIAQDTARQSVDRLVTDLRSAASLTQIVEKAGASDIVFRTIDPLQNPTGTNSANEKRVRYCMSGSTLLRQEQTWANAVPALPALSSCPDSSLTPAAGTVVATNIVNGTTPLFLYDNATLASIRQVEIDLLADTTPGANPKTSEIKTAVTLRNAN